MRIFCIYLLFMLSAIIFAQNLENEINNYQISDITYISKGRQMIANECKQNNVDRIKEVTIHLLEKYNTSHTRPFYPWEKFILSFEIDSLSLCFEATSEYLNPLLTYESLIYPTQDALLATLNHFLLLNYHTYLTQIITSQMNDEEILMMEIFLDAISIGTIETIDQQKLNSKCNEFLAKFPNSEYYKPIRESLRYVYKPGKLGIGLDFGMGYAKMTDRLSRYFDNDIAFDMSLYFTYEELVLKFKLKIASIDAKIDFQENGSWNTADHFNLPFYGLELGYELWENKRFKIETHALLGATEVDYSENDENEDVINPSIAYGFGFTTYIKITNTIAWSYINPKENGSWYASLSCDYINSTFENSYDEYKGGTLFILLGLGMYARPIVRDF